MVSILSLKDITNAPSTAYSDGNIFISNNFENIEHDGKTVKNEVSIIALCLEGKGTVQINDRTYSYQAKDMIFISPNSLFKPINTSEDIKVRLLSFDAKELIHKIVYTNDLWKKVSFIRANPICKLSDYQYNVMIHYFALADLYVQNPEDIYQKEKMNNLVGCWIYDLLTIISENSPTKHNYSDLITSNDITLLRFMEIISLHKGRMRSVQKAAEQINISAKYLSFVIKKSTGKTPQNIIHEYTLNTIKEQLRYSEKSIKEICSEMDFPDASFFGKFFKQHTGITPLQYRKQVLQQKETKNNE